MSKNIRLFKNEWLEKTSHVHPLTPLVMWTPVICWLYWRSFQQLHFIQVGICSSMGLLVWTLTEYLMHRFVFHYKPQTSFQERLVYMFHGIHHDDPDDATRLVMPPIAGILFASILYTFYRILLGEVWIAPFFAAFLIGYLCYDYIHFYVHHFTPQTRLGKMLKQHHMLHHFIMPEARWGVSSPLWDHIFGTMLSKKNSEVVQ